MRLIASRFNFSSLGHRGLDYFWLAAAVGLLLFTGCKATDYTKNQPNICQVHQVAMTRRTVPIAYGMIPMSRYVQPESWRRRMQYYPNPGDCLPATDISMGEKRAVVYVCRMCEAAMKEKVASVETGTLEWVEKELARLHLQAEQESGPEWPRPSRQLAFYLLSGLAAHGVAIDDLPEEEIKLFEMEKQGGSRHRLIEIAKGARITVKDKSIQDKAGTFWMRTATLYVQRGEQWVRSGDGAIAAWD